MDYKEKLIVLLNNTELSEEQKAKLEEIFPGLCESENDRIKKFIENELVCLRACYDEGTERHEQLSNAIAWLEKQGEQKPAFEMKTPEESLGIDSDTYNKIVDECIYGEQNPVDKVEPKFNVGQTIKKEGFNLGFTIVKIEDGFYYNDMGDHFPYTDQENWELVEQKPAYTKEYDFHGVKFIPKFAKGDIIKDKKCGEVSTIEDFSYDTGLYTHTYGQFPITIQDNYEIIAQKPAWSKEDEKIIRRIDSLLYSQCKIHGSEYEEIHNWLKFLRPQNWWKPSDEQMDALESAIVDSISSIQKHSLKSLYNELKKLF